MKYKSVKYRNSLLKRVRKDSLDKMCGYLGESKGDINNKILLVHTILKTLPYFIPRNKLEGEINYFLEDLNKRCRKDIDKCYFNKDGSIKGVDNRILDAVSKNVQFLKILEEYYISNNDNH